MNARINKSGYLDIERSGDFKLQRCPFGEDGCGDWCPLFDEDFSKRKNSDGSWRITIQLKCTPQMNLVYLSDIEDLRPRKEES